MSSAEDQISMVDVRSTFCWSGLKVVYLSQGNIISHFNFLFLQASQADCLEPGALGAEACFAPAPTPSFMKGLHKMECETPT